MKYLLKNGADPNAVDYYGQTPLHYATLKGNIAAAEILLNNSGADVEVIISEILNCLFPENLRLVLNLLCRLYSFTPCDYQECAAVCFR